MHHFRRLITAILLTLLSIMLLFSAGFVYLIVTPWGGKLLVRYFKQEFVAVGLMHVGHYEGTLQNGFVLKGITIRGLTYLPDALLRIQEVRVHLPLWDLLHSDFYIFNARIFIADSDPVVFTGDMHGRQINGNLYAKSLDLHAALRFWANEDIRRNLQGFVSNVDMQVQGDIASPKAVGSFILDDIRYKSVHLTNAPTTVNLEIYPKSSPFAMNGQVLVNSGMVNVRKVDLQILPSKFIFVSDVYNPTMDIHLGAKVEDMEFHLTIKGTSNVPQLSVSSDPPMPADDALRVLFTGNAWSASTSPFSGGVTSTDLAENFLNYSLADIDDQDVGLKTKLTDNLKLGAEMDQMPSQPGETNIYYSRRINGEMDMSEHMSLNISREVMTQDAYPAYQDAQPEPDTQVYVQYKKRF